MIPDPPGLKWEYIKHPSGAEQWTAEVAYHDDGKPFHHQITKQKPIHGYTAHYMITSDRELLVTGKFRQGDFSRTLDETKACLTGEHLAALDQIEMEKKTTEARLTNNLIDRIPISHIHIVFNCSKCGDPVEVKSVTCSACRYREEKDRFFGRPDE